MESLKELSSDGIINIPVGHSMQFIVVFSNTSVVDRFCLSIIRIFYLII